MTPRQLILETASRFRAAGIPDPAEDSALLLASLLSRPPLALRADTDTLLTPECCRAFEKLALQRLTREPLQYLLSEAVFYGRSFFVDERVLIPRPETALLCEWALSLMAAEPAPHILDLCAGSGCIGLTLKKERPDSQVTLADCSEAALDVARRNGERLQAEALFARGDLLDAVSGRRYSWIISNPPYIPSAECTTLQPEVMREPLLALDGGTDGLAFYRRIARTAPAHLLSGGHLMMEFGLGEGPELRQLLYSAGFTCIELRADFAGIDRMIHARWPVREPA